MRLILASTSQRRRSILSLLGLPFEVISPKFEEELHSSRPLDLEVQTFALEKAKSIAREAPHSIIIGSDTMILMGRIKIGKPIDLEDARKILRSLSGKTHQILTGLAIVNTENAEEVQHLERIDVVMRDYSNHEIEDYLSLGESMDKAGAYSIQGKGRSLIQSIRGDYLSAVGLPLKAVSDYLKQQGMKISIDEKQVFSEKLIWKGVI